MKVQVIKNAYYVSENLTNLGAVSEDEFAKSYTHFLVKDDIWEKNDEEDNVFKCISGAWEGEVSEGWWEYKNVKDYLKTI